MAGRASQTRERQRSQQALVTAQVALALVLLVSAGLMIRSFQALRRVDPGFTEPQHVQTFSISIPATLVAEPERVTRMQQEVLTRSPPFRASRRRRSRPGCRWAAIAAAPRSLWKGRRTMAGRRPTGRSSSSRPARFDTLGTRLVAGRDFTWTDLYGARDVAIVSENLARELWGTPAAALGKRVREYYDAQVTLAGDCRRGRGRPRRRRRSPAAGDGVLARAAARELFGHARISVAPGQRRHPHRTRRHREPAREVREAVWSVSPELPLAQVRTLDEVYDQSMARTSFTLVMLAIAGAMALLLGISGLYGVIAYAVSQRRREIGIRLALGAQPREIRRLFVRRGLVMVGLGVAIGLGGAAASPG